MLLPRRTAGKCWRRFARRGSQADPGDCADQLGRVRSPPLHAGLHVDGFLTKPVEWAAFTEAIRSQHHAWLRDLLQATVAAGPRFGRVMHRRSKPDGRRIAYHTTSISLTICSRPSMSLREASANCLW